MAASNEDEEEEQELESERVSGEMCARERSISACSRWRTVRTRHGTSKSMKSTDSWPVQATSSRFVKTTDRPPSHLLSCVITPIAYLLVTSILLSTNLPTQANGYQQAQSGSLAPNSIAPTIDYSHNMRILKLPHSTQVGTLIYRLKGSDGDPNTQLVFGVSGIEGRSLIDVLPVARSWNEADVYLRAPLEEQLYNLTIYVTDGNKTTQVESTIIVTDDNQQPTDATNENSRESLGVSSPFVNAKHVFHVPENTKPDEPIGFVTALESQKSDLPVKFELRGKGADKFAIKYVFGPKGQSKADIVLAQPVDYEKQNLFSLNVLALNGWTNSAVDTRNVATMDIVITVGDVQDTPPVFRNLPQSLKLFNTMQVGELIVKLEAEDGDYADQRPVNFALDANSPLSNYFDIDKSNGELRLKRAMSELGLHATWDSATWSLLTVFASEVPDTTSYDHLWPLMYTKAELPLIMVDLVNEPPQFIGGWQTSGDPRMSSSTKTLHGYLSEPQIELASESSGFAGGTLVRWFTNSSETGSPLLDSLTKSMNGRPTVLDLGLGSNGTFELSLEGQDAQLFQVDPPFPVTKQASFSLSVAPDANKSLFDYELMRSSMARTTFTLDIVAKDFGSPQRQSSRIRCLIELLDINDNAPQFENDLYTFSVYENAQLGQPVGIVRARDADSRQSGRIRYTALTGQESHLFKLNQDNGQISLDGHLDREKRSQYLFLVEARDSSGAGISNYSQVLVNVIDINDNAPVFLQSHYDAVLMADGTFHQPLVVRALDNDEANSANSQVAYEIIAGNQNEQFSIDTVSGAIYPANLDGPDGLNNNNNHKIANVLPQIPSIITEPIVPFGAGGANQHQAGKILPSHEVEEATYPTPQNRFNRQQQTNHNSSGANELANASQHHTANNNGASPRSIEHESERGLPVPAKGPFNYNLRTTGAPPDSAANSGRLSVPPMDTEQLPALDLLLNLESSEHRSIIDQTSQPLPRSLPPISPVYSTANSYNSMKVPPVTTLIVRAHDFGIPLRSSTVKVNIYNQALLTRSVSVILNGTAEQLEPRREAIERAFSSLTGSRATIESIDALSESSSLSVARVRLTVPQHSLVDLTDLSALMGAIDYRPSEQHFRQSAGGSVTHYYTGDRLNPTMSSNITNGGQILHEQGLFGDAHGYTLDTSRLEGRLLLYIIMVGVCIFAVLAIWAICFCFRPNQVKIIEKTVPIEPISSGSYRTRQDGESQTANKTLAKSTNAATSSPIGNNLAKERSPSSKPKRNVASGLSSTMNELLLPANLAATNNLKPDHYSMYNGQVWFEPAGQTGHFLAPISGRRASSAPSAASLDSAVRSPATWRVNELPGRLGGSVTPRDATGQFFPNTIGYTENLAALSALDRRRRLELEAAYAAGSAQQKQHYQQTSKLSRRHRHRKVVPMDTLDGLQERLSAAGAYLAPSKPPRMNLRDSGHANQAFEEDLEAGAAVAARQRIGASRTGSERLRRNSAGANSLDGSTSGNSRSSSQEETASLVLDSDQELLGFDSTGTPIIATHTRASVKPLLVEVLETAPVGSLAGQTARRQRPAAGLDTARTKPTIGGSGSSKNSERPALALAGGSVTREVGSAAETDAPVDGAQVDNSKPEGDKEALGRRDTDNGDNDERKTDEPLSAASKQVEANEEERRRQVRRASSQGDLMSELNERLSRRQQTVADAPARPSEAAAPGELGGLGTEAGSVARTTRAGEQRGKPLQRTVKSASSDSSTGTSATSATTIGGPNENSTAKIGLLHNMKNGELLERQSIFAITYSGLATDKPPAET